MLVPLILARESLHAKIDIFTRVMTTLFTPEALLGLICIVTMLVITGIPLARNAAFIIKSLPATKHSAGWLAWGSVNLFFRILFLVVIIACLNADKSLFSLFGNGVQVRELVYLGLGFYLLSRAVIWLNRNQAARNAETTPVQHNPARALFLGGIPAGLDAAVITIGMSDAYIVMVAGILISMIILLTSGNKIASLGQSHPTLFTLSVAFCVLISLLLFIEGIAGPTLKVSKTYIYFAMAFGFAVQLISIRYRRNRRLL
jgi:predicted tellurium resistance membrane protein TerC